MLLSEETMVLSEDDEEFPIKQVTEVIFILITCVFVVGGNLLVIVTVTTSVPQKEPLDYYILSLAFADLLCGIIVLPLSVHPAIVGEWVYGDFLCRLTGYVDITLWSVTVYTFMWISVDRYLAIRKPLRYDTIQTSTRCQCWMLFTWITSVFLCCPPLFGFSKGHFYKDGYICMLDLKHMVPYSITLAILVLAPSIITVVYSYIFIFLTVHRLRKYMTKEEKEYATAANENLSNPDHVMCFLLIVVFWVSWIPWFGLRIWEQASGHYVRDHALHFSLLWFGILNSVWKPFIYIAVSPKFRFALKFMFVNIFCRWKARQQMII